jgi:hypothetical protein
MAHMVVFEPIAIYLGHCSLIWRPWVHPRHTPRAFPLWLRAPRCLGAVLLLALPACWLVLGHRFCLGRRRNLLPSVGLLLADVIQLTRCFPCFVITDCSVTFCLCLRRLALANPFSLFQLGDSGVAFASEFGDFFSAALVRYRTP